MSTLREIISSIDHIVEKIHHYRLEWNRKRETSISKRANDALAINVWAEKLHHILGQALAIAQNCRILRFDVFSHSQTSRRINSLISPIEKHLQLVPLVLLQQQT